MLFRSSGLTGVAAISVGNYNACALVAGGTGRCWGFNGSGQLGNGLGCTPYAVPDNCQSNAPVAVVGLSGATALSTGFTASCARLVGGAARCWGLDTDGDLGDGQGGVGSWSNIPVAVLGLP